MAHRGDAHTFGLVLSGGGARGAYEAGVMHFIRSGLPKQFRTHAFALYCGSSVGAINACVLASRAEQLETQGIALRQGWEQLRQQDIYKRNVSAIGKFVGTSVLGIAMNLFRRAKTESDPAGIHFRGLVDTSPFPKFLQRMVQWKKLTDNINRRIVHGVSVTLTNMHTGKLEFVIQKNQGVPYSGNYLVRFEPIRWQHVMGSAAIPVLFPPVNIDGTYYSDGGMRLNTPMSPAIHMGADRVMVIGMHAPNEKGSGTEVHDDKPHTAPTLGEIIGKMLNSVFLDRLDYDLKQMDRINNVIDWAEQVYGADFLDKVNAHLRTNKITGDVASRGLKRLKVFPISPSRNVCDVFSEVVESGHGISEFSAFEKMLLKFLDVDMHRGQEFLSYFLFHPNYIRALLELGYNDAKAKQDQIIAFFEGK